MDEQILEKYKAQMLEMYRKANRAVPTVTEPVTESEPENVTEDTASGKLVGLVTTIRSLYPVPNAKITVFEGSPQDMTIIDTDFTDQSGKTKEFILPTPEKALSLDEQNTIIPYALYNMMIEADGYISNIHLNIPVFSGVTSLQRSNLILSETAGVNKGPQIFDESQKYDL